MTRLDPETVPDDFEPVPETKWRPRKGRPPDRVLFATDGRAAVAVIDHIGPDVAYILGDDLVAGVFLDEELRPWRFPGIWVWEGRLHGRRDYWGEYDEWTEGEVRPMDEDEARAVREGDLVWDPALWIVKEEEPCETPRR